jgi:rod shape-determining protein MreC
MIKLTASFRGIVQRFSFPILIGAAIGLMLLSRVDNPVVTSVRTQVVDVLAPAMDVLSRPVAAVQSGVDYVDHFFTVFEENARLREENERLLHWQAVARRLGAENEEFRDLLSTVAEPRSAFVTARVIGMSSGTFVRTALISAGEHDGVTLGQAVVTAQGMIGRVVEVGNRSARVLLLTDLNSRIPVVFERTRDAAVLTGDNTDLLRLLYVTEGMQIEPGDRLVTSGEGGMLPPGLPVGQVIALKDGVWQVQPLVDPDRVEHVRILDYALPGLLPTTLEAGAIDQLW